MDARNVPSMKKTLLPLALACALAAATGIAYAEKADSAKPMNIEADALRHDELQQTSSAYMTAVNQQFQQAAALGLSILAGAAAERWIERPLAKLAR